MFNRRNKNTGHYILAGILVLLLSLLAVFPSQAQAPCRAVKDGINSLRLEYGETAVFRGVSSIGHMIILFLNKETGTWTVGKVALDNSNKLCAVDAGNSGQLPSAKAGEGSPTIKPKL
jgi:hypothetical protein|tara:strand:+ start:319 stop:672 length:354 start_codon:yes stop_codon:yes gene_type:complete